MNNEKQTILVVDDTPENIDVLSGVLRPDYKVKAALNGERALKIAATEPRPDIVLLDIMMPGMDGYEVCEKLKSDPATAKIPVIFITAKTEVADEQHGFELGAVDYITKPISPPLVQARVRTQLALYDQNRELERKVRERTEELIETRLEIIRRLGRAAEYKDNETGLHVIRMSHYSRLIAEALSGDEEWVDLVFNAAPMHDIGKIGVPDRVLLKPGKLTVPETELVRNHRAMGLEILKSFRAPESVLEIIRYSTMWYRPDGNGSQPQGEDLPLGARMLAIVDAYDSASKEMVWRGTGTVTVKDDPAKQVKQLKSILTKMGKQWDKILDKR